MTARYIGSSELMERRDVEVQMGGPQTVKSYPALAEWLLRQHRTLKAHRRAECDARRAKRESRWASIAAGDREPVSILHLENFLSSEAEAA